MNVDLLTRRTSGVSGGSDATERVSVARHVRHFGRVISSREDGDEALSDNNMPSGQPPVPYSLDHQVVPSEGYYYPDYPAGQQAEGDSDWERIARLLWFRKWWILGAMILGTVLDELERRDKNTALATLCVGGGMGTATIIERV